MSEAPPMVLRLRGVRCASSWSRFTAPPMVYISGEEMSRYTMELIMDKWVKPSVDISKWEFYDLSCKEAAFEVGKGRVLTTFFPESMDEGKPIIVDGREVKDDRSCVVVYDNPLDNVEDLAHIFFQRCLEAKVVPYVVTKKTVFKWQEGFWQIMKEVFDAKYKVAEDLLRFRRNYKVDEGKMQEFVELALELGIAPLEDEYF
ncbi:unnamed protein product [Durusdinium trenchii]|uniref:Uncharacterized protein n=1 Tax=Durusdinium trenchii TaxID=1381693 RepID=A0ABP0JMD2_9DINO